MSQVELVILVVLALMALPDLLRKAGRSSLLYPAYLLIGLAVAPFLDTGAQDLLREVGQFGFILLLFSVGLEIDIPAWREYKPAARFAFGWVVVQAPFILIIGMGAGAGLGDLSLDTFKQAAIAALALSACSIGLSHHALQIMHFENEGRRHSILLKMVALEVHAIILLAASDVLFIHGFGWRLAIRIAGIAAAVVLVGLFANHLTVGLKAALERTVRWKVHFTVIFVLIVAALGQRLGLSAAKTAFFLGFFLTRSTHEGLQIKDTLKPISQELLVPIFFVSLGAGLPVAKVFSVIGFLGVCTAVFLLAFRKLLCRKEGLGMTGDTHVLLGPNLTMVAIAVTIMQIHASPAIITWLSVSGLLMSILPMFMVKEISAAGIKPPRTPPDEEASELLPR